MIWKKIHKFSILKNSIRMNKGFQLTKGNYGIKNLKTCLVSHVYLEKIRRRISRQFKRLEKKRFKIYFRIFIWQSYTKKPLLTRMGKGAGPVHRWVTFLRAGYIFLEILSHKSFFLVQSIATKALYNLPIKALFLSSLT